MNRSFAGPDRPRRLCDTETRPVLRVAFLIAAIGFACSPSLLPAADSPDEPKPPFLIGYLRSESPTALNREWFRQLVSFLNQSRPAARFRKQLAKEGFGRVALVSDERFADLVSRMEYLELDCVFCPAVAFVRQIGRDKDVIQSSYTVVFQVRRPSDIGNPPRRHGAIIVRNNHPLYRKQGERDGPLTSQALSRLARSVASEPVAFVSRYSAPGYIYPLNELFKSGNRLRPGRPVFRGSSDEVVKLVLSGVVKIGACEISAIKEVLSAADLQSSAPQLLDTLLITPGSPVDPVVFLNRFSPDRSELGNTLRALLEKFFASNRPGNLRLVASNNLDFRSLKQAVEQFDKNFFGRSDRP